MKKLLMLLGLILVSGLPAQAAESLYRVTRVADGDTLEVCSLRRSCVLVRVNNLNTPEKRFCSPAQMSKMSSCEPCLSGAQLGLRASKYAEALFARQPRVRVKTVGKDLYGRTVADVFLWDGRSYAEVMISQGLGVPYPCPRGRCVKRPRPWCSAIDN